MRRNETTEPGDQHVEQFWETPSKEQIVEISRAHVKALEASTDDVVWVQAGMHHIILYTVGRRSGIEHSCALPTWRDHDGDRIVIGSFAGSEKEPDWVRNMRSGQPSSRIRVRSQTGEFWSEYEFLEGSQHSVIWAQLCTDRAWYEDYQSMTERLIPLVRLPETTLIIPSPEGHRDDLR